MDSFNGSNKRYNFSLELPNNGISVDIVPTNEDDCQVRLRGQPVVPEGSTHQKCFNSGSGGTKTSKEYSELSITVMIRNYMSSVI